MNCLFSKNFRCKTFPLHDQFLCLQNRTINLPGKFNIIFFILKTQKLLTWVY